MEPIRTVNVTNMIRANVSIARPEFGINRVWSDFGQTMKIPFENLEQGMWDPAIQNLFTSGILYIDNLQDKIDLGLEPADAAEPVNIVLLDENKMENLLKNTPLTVFKKEVSALTRVQVDSLISYAINKKIIDPDKCSWLKDLTGKDILKSISQKDDMLKAEKKLAEAEKIRKSEEIRH